ncbi:DUF2169 family type VI secretion system accessory protein [Vibrio mexicanus]|uniref:DUF2169 family type VI secretion system accessory protein n=1 Tax=Vibrio mexicanus TaxID=1004326 RepID=UPI00063C8074|nr:DUF2169 domain-containing protein [Vibrio mexicanus]
MELWSVKPHEKLSTKGRLSRDLEGEAVWLITGKQGWKWSGEKWNKLDDVEIFEAPQYMGEPGISALKYEDDFAFCKKNTDVVVVGRARSYAKKPVDTMECRLLVDEHVDKTIKIVGQRHWVPHAGSITVSTSQKFIERETDYSHALGGEHYNRAGGGVATSLKGYQERPVPSVFYPDENWQLNTNKVRVAGFGPLPAFFEERTQFLGTYDEDWQENRRPLLPKDFDMRFYQCAPSDQQCKGFLLGGERLMLSGFSHDEVLDFRIPSQAFSAIAQIDGVDHLSDMPLHTVFIDADEAVITLTYTGSVVCKGKEHLLANTKIVEREAACL